MPNVGDQRLATLDFPSGPILSRVRCIALLGREGLQLHIRQAFPEYIRRIMRSQCLDDCRQRVSVDARQICLARHCDWKGQLLHWRRKLRREVASVAPRIDAIPAVHGQVNGIQAVERERGRMAILAQALITQPCRNAVCSKERRQKMAFRIAIAAADSQHLGGRTGNGLKSEIAAVPDFIADPFVAPLGDDNAIF